MTTERPAGHGIPAETTSLVGRRRDLARVRQLLSRAKLVTVTGPGGIGKTRLAMRTARDDAHRFPDGVRVVDLAHLQDGERLPEAVALALGLDGDCGPSPQAVLARYLADRRMLLVLDNCEHLAEHCAPLIQPLIAACPKLHVLATSRHPLGVYGEYLMDLGPLAFPDADLPPPPQTMARYASVRLFVQRASAQAGAFGHDTDSWRAAGLICARLDGIPLAIELAAAWLRVLTVQQVLERLSDCLRFPAGSACTVRHRTLHATIDRSFQLCTPGEQRTWLSLSVFRGGFDLEAAEAVCTGDDLARQDVLSGLAALVNKSVLTRDNHGGQAHYRMLETIRCYGHTRLRAQRSEADDVRQRHGDYYRNLALRAAADWFSPHQSLWFARLRRNHANLREAVEFGLSTPGQVQGVLELAASLWSHRLGRGGLEEERHWLIRALAADTTPTPARARALWADGWLALLRGDSANATARLTECRAIADDLDHAPSLAHAGQLAGLVALFRDDYSRAIPLLEDTLERHRAAGDLTGQWTTLFLLTVACCLSKDERAADYGRQSLALCDTHGALWSRCYALWALGLQRWLTADLPGATAALKDALRIGTPSHNLFAVTQCLEVLAWIAAENGSGAHAATLLGAAQELWQRIGVATPVLGRLLDHRAACERRLRYELDGRQLADAVRAGAELTVPQAIDLALGWAPDWNMAPATEPSRSLPTLTTRESQVAELIAEGLSDRQIAARLVLSPRTIEGHVQRILAKLDFTSRVQIATWTIGHRAAD
ncbi:MULTISPECIES: LuxR C-terminal-related transcriptional regulator [unclassified Streptomyces]|uniref:ATP-binding protein n=1 Tax=unclassified Streptomyces TaxID=2593676 RepID=UPI001F045826|nr:MULTISPECIES: LuxR C-terminal-related transcriptional regulator [unclassified Streptomyces]MCH0566229.1 LuxR family transcriptional regulator [Streptomyces sp. MUM 2J]MCH0568396.1 LuxR family transcriptional regulator [Streptomyces sp. MUM 136J]